MTVVVGLSKPFEGSISLLSLIFLDEPKDDVNHDHSHDDGEIVILLYDKRNRCCNQNNIDEWTFDLV